jgi:hypothetical protein
MGRPWYRRSHEKNRRLVRLSKRKGRKKKKKLGILPLKQGVTQHACEGV